MYSIANGSNSRQDGSGGQLATALQRAVSGSNHRNPWTAGYLAQELPRLLPYFGLVQWVIGPHLLTRCKEVGSRLTKPRD